MQIAPLQKNQLDFLNGMLKDIEGTVDRGSRDKFREIGNRLDGWAARIAVIGQVKAGKSTFMNAFLQSPGLLPSDINPWTSVVTNIRVNMPNDPAMGASFEFFSEADWQEIIDGSERIRRMTEELLPGFDTEILKKQSQEMRDRAQRRLGKHYHALLGSQHDYDFLSPDLLKRYVCAGPGSDDGLTRESLGRYAAITKVANVFTRMPEFKIPAIVTDTPGVNDPFLVRDEFTCRSLDKSDIFVVVLSAHQALTDVDIALIRILAQQDSKDVVIFVNRIDELDNYAHEVPRVVADVSARLSDAIPGIEFTIVAGSAHLADLAYRTDEEAEQARNDLDTDELGEFLIETYGELPDDQIDRMILASGMTQVKQTLSMVIDNGIGCLQLNQILCDIRAELNGIRFSTRQERDSIAAEIEKLGSSNAAEAIADLTSELEKITKSRSALDERLDECDGSIEASVSGAWSTLEKSLNQEIETFVEQQRDVFRERVMREEARKQSAGAVEINLTPLQVKLEQLVHQGFDGARANIDGAMETCLSDCEKTIVEMFGEAVEDVTLADLPYESFTSTLALAKKSLQIDMISESNWLFWRRKKINVEKTVETLKAIAVAELRPSIEKIMAAFNEAQADRASAGMERIRVMLRVLESTVAERTQRLRKDKRALEELQDDPEKLNRLTRRLQSQYEVLERRLQHLSAADSTLSNAELSEAA